MTALDADGAGGGGAVAEVDFDCCAPSRVSWRESNRWRTSKMTSLASLRRVSLDFRDPTPRGPAVVPLDEFFCKARLDLETDEGGFFLAFRSLSLFLFFSCSFFFCRWFWSM